MPNRVQWDPGYATGDEALDERHRRVLTQCNALADCLSDGRAQGDADFWKTFDALMIAAREHFSAEDAQLAAWGCPLLDEHREEADEFEYLAAEIITADNFGKFELQRFLALWWAGHLAGASKKHRAWAADTRG